MLSKVFNREELNMENMTLKELEDLEFEIRHITDKEFQTLKWNKLYRKSICDGSVWIDEIEDESEYIRVLLKGTDASLYFHVVKDQSAEWDKRIEERSPDAFGMWAVIESRGADEWVSLINNRQEALSIAWTERDRMPYEERKKSTLTVAYISVYRDQNGMIRAYAEESDGSIDADHYESIKIEM